MGDVSRDLRLEEAKNAAIEEIAARLGISGLKRMGLELVGPCPVCGGRDRFSIAPKRGVWNCRICARGGSVLDLVAHVENIDLAAAITWILGDAGSQIPPEELECRRRLAAAAKAKREAEAERYRRAAVREARGIWGQALPAQGSPVEGYFAARGLALAIPASIRFLPDHPYRKRIGGKVELLHRGPCMIAAVQGPDRRVQAVHQTWLDLSRPKGKAEILDPEGVPLPAKMVRGSKKGAAIRLSPWTPSGVLVMGEGIETTLTAAVVNAVEGATYWAAVDLGNMSGRMLSMPGSRWSGQPDLEDRTAWLPPPETRRLVLIQDGDSNPEQTRARLEACMRRARAAVPGLRCQIVHPGAGKDLNDLKMGQDNGRTV